MEQVNSWEVFRSGNVEEVIGYHPQHDYRSSMMNIGRTGSNGLMAIKNCRNARQKRISQARAAKMSFLFEMGETEDMTTNRNSSAKQNVFPSRPIKLLREESSGKEKQHVKKLSKQETDCFEILDENQNPNRMMEIKKIKPQQPKSKQVLPRGSTSSDEDGNLEHSISFEDVRSRKRALFSMIPMVSRPANNVGYRAANGVFYNVPNLC